ncbi:dTDP-4-dehydrorhamnose 3,5-epimerase [Arenibaculum pallidiluteum]|uniref:dTDP-4-dehydrorhamnose 3,5-epimerase n=1 Tax=Arenibaculum pallidiluteum TaxID=2812559 RepID=UPI001A973C6B|nr:dTDP-4-dehydrorhamnose 3,5-epimerase [Arenibaculum pallidiluteum]
MKVIETEIPAVKLLMPRRFGDSRGWFAETWNRKALLEAGVDLDFVQDNQSLSVPSGTVRGLHFQSPPFAQDKLVRVLRGAIVDVAVDIRRDSPTYGRHVMVRLDAAEGAQLLVPKGFAHGFVTLEPETEVLYKVTNYYAPQHDHGVLWNDPDLGIAWPVQEGAAHLSDKDLRQPRLRDIQTPF